MLNLSVEVEIVKDDDKLDFATDSEGNIIAFEDGGGFASGLMQRIPHPELTKSGTCPECAVDSFRIFDPQTMEGVDGQGKVKEVGWHYYCVCEDIPAEIGKRLGYKEKNKFDFLKEQLSKNKNIGIPKKQLELLKSGAIKIEDLFGTRRNDPIKQANELKYSLAYKNKKELLAIAVQSGIPISELEDLKNREIIDRIVGKKRKIKSNIKKIKSKMIPILKLGGKNKND